MQPRLLKFRREAQVYFERDRLNERSGDFWRRDWDLVVGARVGRARLRAPETEKEERCYECEDAPRPVEKHRAPCRISTSTKPPRFACRPPSHRRTP